MAHCPFAVQSPISGPAGPYKSGPFRIVHHTTEGSTAQAAMDAFKAHKSDPHFTVDGAVIHQHIDTGVGARALRHPAGTMETNLASAVQIETVGFAGRPKAVKTLTNLARLLRWIEATHGVPLVWPNGPPKPAVNGADPGGHNRDGANWAAKGGHYGHCHVPNNIHWDPGYTAVETAFLMAAEFSPDGHLANTAVPDVKALLDRQEPLALAGERSPAMVGHDDVGETP